MTKVTSVKLNPSKPKRWNPETIEINFKTISDADFELRLYELGKLLYDEFCQRPKSQDPSLGMIQEVHDIELKRTGTDG